MRVSLVTALLSCSMLCAAQGRNVIFDPNVKSLQVVVNQDWLSPPVMVLNSSDVINVSFDELSHNYHRYVYRVEHCEADWSVSQDIFESDYLRGFNGNTIDDYQSSIGTTVDYTHYKMELPNDRCQLKISGNYRLTVYDEDNDNRKVLQAEFMVTEQTANVGMEVTTNTDIDVNGSHQQVTLKVNYGQLRVTNPDEQIFTVVTQNNCQSSARRGLKPNIRNASGLEWTHNRQLIFDGGNEYRKFEVLALSHPTMGIDRMSWDGEYYNAYPFTSEPRRNYLYDEDANGAFYLRNSDNEDNDYASDYVYVHYKLMSPYVDNATIAVDGWWTTDADREKYSMTYDTTDNTYNTTIFQKQGYYSYRYIALQADGTVEIPPTEGNFFQTENRYQAYVYYKGTGERTWRLAGYRQAGYRSDL